jgi:nucleoside-diphosphate-sugar epimerase
MEILLTGASGFLGRQVLPMLLAEGHTVYSLSRKATEKPSAMLVEVPGDLMEDEWISDVPWDRIDVVAHLAAAGVKASSRNWRDAFEVNVGGTVKLLSAMKRNATKNPRLVVTRSFYERVLHQEPELRNNAYIATKSVSTELIKAWSRDYKGPVCFATLFQIYGPGDDRGSVLTYAAHQLAAGQTAHFGSGVGVRDWLYVDDAASAIVALLEADTKGVSEWDIGSGRLASVRSMVETMSGLAGVSRDLLVFDPARDRTDLTLHLAAECMPPSWKPEIPVEEGLRRTWASATRKTDA